MTSVLHEFHELHERRTEIIIHLLNLKHERKVIDWKQGALLIATFFGLAIVLPIAMWLLGGEATLIPIWQSLPKIFWTTVVVGTLVWGVIFFRRLTKEEEATLQA